MTESRLLVTLAIAVLLACGGIADGAPTTTARPAETDRWLSGPELKRQLASSVSMSWTETPFRQAVQALSRSRQVAILLDRRVDPDGKITLSLPLAPLQKTLSRMARERSADTTQFGPVAYIGPPRVAQRLRTLAALRTQDAQRLPADARKPLLAVRPMDWDDLETPRELVAQLAAEAGVAVEGQELLPHDLWAGQSLPAMTWVDRLTLLAAQLDLTFQIAGDGRRVRLAPLPDEIALERSYPGGAGATDRVRRWRELAPEAKIEVAAGRIVVRGRLEDHERLNRPASSAPLAKQPGIEVHTLVVRQTPLNTLLEQFEQKLDLSFEWDQAALRRAGISMTANVSVDVKNATLDELLSAALAPAGLSFQRDGRVVQITPRP